MPTALLIDQPRRPRPPRVRAAYRAAFPGRLAQRATATGHTGCVNALGWAAGGHLLLSGSDDHHICLWDPFTLEMRLRWPTPHVANIFGVAFLPGRGDSHVVSCARDALVAKHVLREDGSAESSHVWDGHSDAVKRVAPISPHAFLTVSEDASVRLFDDRSRESSTQVCGSDAVPPLNSIALCPSRPELFLVGGDSPYAMLFDMRACGGGGSRTRGTVRRFAPGGVAGESVSGVAWAPSGGRVVLNYQRGDLWVFEDPLAPTETDVLPPARQLMIARQLLRHFDLGGPYGGIQSRRRLQNVCYCAVLGAAAVDGLSPPEQAEAEAEAEAEEEEEEDNDEEEEDDGNPESPETARALVVFAMRLVAARALAQVLETGDDELFRVAVGALRYVQAAGPPDELVDDIARAVEALVGAGAASSEDSDSDDDDVSFARRAAAAAASAVRASLLAAAPAAEWLATPALDPRDLFEHMVPPVGLPVAGVVVPVETREAPACVLEGAENHMTVKSVSFYGDHAVMAGSDDGVILVWDARTGAVVNAFSGEQGHGDRFTTNVLEPSPVLPMVASCGIENCVRIWEPTGDAAEAAERAADVDALRGPGLRAFF